MSDDHIRSALAQLEAEQEALRTDVLAALEARSSAIISRLTDVSGKIDSLRDDIAANMGKLDVVRGASDTTRVEIAQIQDQMFVMWKQIKALETSVRELKGENGGPPVIWND